VSAEVLRKYFVEGGKAEDAPYALLAMYRGAVSRARHEVTILANFVEVWLAKQGHNGAVGINLLTKVQMPNIASLYGAMLAGVDYVLMGAGIPKEIPGVLDRLAAHEPARMKLDVDGGGRRSTSSWIPVSSGTVQRRRTSSAEVLPHHLAGVAGPDAHAQGQWPR
jgi:nitronate monooxygenase